MRGDNEMAAVYRALGSFLAVYLEDDEDIEHVTETVVAFLDDELADAENRARRRET